MVVLMFLLNTAFFSLYLGEASWLRSPPRCANLLHHSEISHQENQHPGFILAYGIGHIVVIVVGEAFRRARCARLVTGGASPVDPSSREHSFTWQVWNSGRASAQNATLAHLTSSTHRHMAPQAKFQRLQTLADGQARAADALVSDSRFFHQADLVTTAGRWDFRVDAMPCHPRKMGPCSLGPAVVSCSSPIVGR